MSAGHRNLDTTELHRFAYVSTTDPGAVGAGVGWLDTSGGTGLWTLKVRNAANTGWENVTVQSTNVRIYNPDSSAYVTWKCRNNADGLPELYAVD